MTVLRKSSSDLKKNCLWSWLRQIRLEDLLNRNYRHHLITNCCPPTERFEVSKRLPLHKWFKDRINNRNWSRQHYKEQHAKFVIQKHLKSSPKLISSLSSLFLIKRHILLSFKYSPKFLEVFIKWSMSTSPMANKLV